MAIKKKDIIEALQATDGVIKYAAIKLGCRRETIHRRANEDDDIRQAIDEAREGFLDEAEYQLRTKVRMGDNQMIVFALSHLGKNRGYVKKEEIEHSGDLGLDITIEYVDPIDETEDTSTDQ